jgi:acyl-coenzyme A synthetase/AMP-(fatty) acid ligase
MDGYPINPASIFSLCRQTLEGNAVPSYLQVVDAIPKSASEKNLDRLLRDEFNKEAENVYASEDFR